MPKTYELLNEMVPTRLEKRRVARSLGYKDEETLYKWCRDPEGSGRLNPLDMVMGFIDYAVIYHPDAAIGLAQFVSQRVAAHLASSGETVPLADLVIALQPATERETLDVAAALSRALRQMLLGGNCDTAALLKEIDEAMQQLTKAAVMLRASQLADSSAKSI